MLSYLEQIRTSNYCGFEFHARAFNNDFLCLSVRRPKQTVHTSPDACTGDEKGVVCYINPASRTVISSLKLALILQKSDSHTLFRGVPGGALDSVCPPPLGFLVHLIT